MTRGGKVKTSQPVGWRDLVQWDCGGQVEVRANRRGPVGGLLKVEDASSLVGVEAGFFDDIIESAAIMDFLEGKLGV